jgi:hypothetical protein
VRLRAGRRVVRAQPGQPGQFGGPVGEELLGGGDARRGEQAVRPGVDGHADQARQRPLETIGLRWIHRDRGDPGIEAGEERDHKVHAGRVQQHRPVAGRAPGLDDRGRGPHPAVQFGVVDRFLLLLTVREEADGDPLAVGGRPHAQQIGQAPHIGQRARTRGGRNGVDH